MRHQHERDRRRPRPSPPARSPADRHSRRSTNHSSPTPGVIFVSSTNAQVHGQRNPHTIATASSSEMLPPAISIAPTDHPEQEQVPAGQHPHRADEDRRPGRDEPRPRQQVERVDEHRERRRVRVRADRVPVGATGVQVVEVQPEVGAGVLRRDDLAGERVADVDRRVGAGDDEHPDDDGDDDVRDVQRARGPAITDGTDMRALSGRRRAERGPGIETAGVMPAVRSRSQRERSCWRIARGIPRTEGCHPGQLPRTAPILSVWCSRAPPGTVADDVRGSRS